MTTSPQPLEDPIAAGRDALAAGAWADARARVPARRWSATATPPRRGRDSAGRPGGSRTGAHASRRASAPTARYRADGEPGAAARVAAWLAADFYEFRGEDAVGRRLARARAPAARRAPARAPTTAGCALHEGRLRAQRPRRRRDRGPRWPAAPRALGRELGVPDLEAVGLAQEGIALVVARAASRRACAASTRRRRSRPGEELELPISQGWALCCLISACDGRRRLPARRPVVRRSMRAFAERWGARQLLGVCRSAYGRVLATGGDWDAAEAELMAAVGGPRGGAARAWPAAASSRLGELRARQGRADEARALFERAGTDRSALLGLGELALDAGDAAARGRRRRARPARPRRRQRPDRVPALELLVRARRRARRARGRHDRPAAARGRRDAARDRLHARPRRLGGGRARRRPGRPRQRPPRLRGRARPLQRGRARPTTPPAPASRSPGRWPRSVAPRPRGAEARAARDTFEALGAAPRRRARRGACCPTARRRQRRAPSLGDLTARELDVLRLVAQGLSDAEIADAAGR